MICFVIFIVSVNPSRPADLKECFNVNLELLHTTSVRKRLVSVYFLRLAFPWCDDGRITISEIMHSHNPMIKT